jgi:hypothetical protein
MLLRCNLGYEFWPYAVLHSAYLHNRTPSSTSGSVSPYERLYGRVPSLGNLRIFGCLAYAKVPDEKRKKLFEKSIRTPLLERLPGMQYKVLDLDNGDIHYVRCVKFDEHQFPAYGSRTGNSSLQKKRITSSSQIKTVLPTMHHAHPRWTMTLTAMMKLMIQMTSIILKWLSRTDPWQPRKHLLKGVHTHQVHHMLQRMVMTPTTCNYIHKLLKSVTIPVDRMRHL